MSEDDYIDAEVVERLLDEIVALEDRATQAEARMQWQSIETAPEDKPVLVYQRMLIGGEHGHFFEVGLICNGDLVNVEGMCPTHWMPLPEPPK